jgi:hypothetical protein
MTGIVLDGQGDSHSAVAVFDIHGALLWSWVDPHSNNGYAQGIAFSPDSRTVFANGATGETLTSFDDDWYTIAFSARSGRRLWRTYLARHNHMDEWPMDLVWVDHRLVGIGAAEKRHPNGTDDYDGAVVATDPRTGRSLGTLFYDGGHGDEYLYAAAAARGMVVVTGESARLEYLAGAPVSVQVWNSGSLVLGVDPRSMRLRWITKPPTPGPASYAYAIAAGHGDVGVAVENDLGDHVDSYWLLPEHVRDVVVGAAYVHDSGGAFPSVVLLDAKTGTVQWQQSLHDLSRPVSWLSGLTFNRASSVLYAVGGASAIDGFAEARPVVQPPLYWPAPSDGVAAAFGVQSKQKLWSSYFNDDGSTGTYATAFDGVTADHDGVFVAGQMDTRSRLAWSGTLNGTILRYAP